MPDPGIYLYLELVRVRVNASNKRPYRVKTVPLGSQLVQC